MYFVASFTPRGVYDVTDLVYEKDTAHNRTLGPHREMDG